MNWWPERIFRELHQEDGKMGGVPEISPHSNNNLVASHGKSTFVRTLKSMEDLAKHWCCQRPKICFEKAGPCLDDELIDHSPGYRPINTHISCCLGTAPFGFATTNNNVCLVTYWKTHLSISLEADLQILVQTQILKWL